MQTISDVSFDTGKLPDGWIDEAREGTLKDGLLHSGRNTSPNFILPGHGWGKLRLEITVEMGPSSIIEFGNGRTSVVVYFGSGRHCVRTHGAATLAANKHPIPAKDGPRSVVFEFDSGMWRALVDGEEMIAYTDETQRAMAGRVGLAFWSDCVVHRVRVLGDEPLPAPLHTYPDRQSDDFHLEVTVDLPDDLYYAPYTIDMLDQLFAEYARWGVRRCHWIYDGKDACRWWHYFPEPRFGNYLQTVENLGGEILDAAVNAAHQHGIELYGIFKPFEMAYMLHTYGEGTENAKKYGRFSRIGGVIYRCPDFTIEHRELMTRRKPGNFGPAENAVFTRIDLVADDEAPAGFGASDVRIFVSDDNNTYRPYDGPIKAEELVEDYPIHDLTSSGGRPTGQTRRSRVMRFTGLDIRSNFLALVAPSDSRSFGNTLVGLVHVFGDKGEERLVTLGLEPRAGQTTYDIGRATLSDSYGLDFCRRGIEFDKVDGTPSACLTGYDGMREWHAFDGDHGFIGIARGKEETSVGVGSPSFLETRQWWLGWVRDLLDAGVDGVELRQRNHHTHLAWAEFGFEKPLRDEFLARHGVDIWETDDFDRAAWRRLRGEALTQFYREARQLVTSRGKPMGIHISRTMDMEPDQGAAMETHFDWRTWIDEGLADSVTMKEVWPRSPLAEEILAHTRPKNVAVIFSPFANGIWRQPGGVQVCADRIRQAREGGYDGFQYYESCAIMRAHPDGRLEMEQPELRELFQRELVKR